MTDQLMYLVLQDRGDGRPPSVAHTIHVEYDRTTVAEKAEWLTGVAERGGRYGDTYTPVVVIPLPGAFSPKVNDCGCGGHRGCEGQCCGIGSCLCTPGYLERIVAEQMCVAAAEENQRLRAELDRANTARQAAQAAADQVRADNDDEVRATLATGLIERGVAGLTGTTPALVLANVALHLVDALKGERDERLTLDESSRLAAQVDSLRAENNALTAARQGADDDAPIAEQVAAQFHSAYERLAPEHGYETRRESAVPWPDVPRRNRELMTAVVLDLLSRGVVSVRSFKSEPARTGQQPWDDVPLPGMPPPQ